MSVLRPNAAAVAAKVIDGEAIIMNLNNGAYYSMDGVGAVIWELIEGGHSAEAIRDGVASRYALPVESVQADVQRLLDELLAEQLIVAAAAGPEANGNPGATASATAAYAAPVLNKYTEMADLLALDPPMPTLGGPPTGPQGG